MGRASHVYGALALPYVIVIAGCGGTDGLQRVVFDDQGALDEQRQLIDDLITDTIDLASNQLPVNTVVVTVTADATRVVPGYGLGGYAVGPEAVEIVIDPQFSDLEQILIARLPYVMAHELHHTVRLRDPGLYMTLLEALVFEGMADHFATRLLDAELAPWSEAFPSGDTQAYLDRARPLFDSTFDFGAWFFGINTDLPRWTGYTLGYRLLDDYFNANPDQGPVSEVNAPADQFRPGG